MKALLRDWDGEFVLLRHDHATGATMIIAVHSTTMGIPTGGTRLRSYPDFDQALRDAMRLAQGMTQKFAVIDFPRGGGKGVLAVPAGFDPADRTGLLRRYGRWLASLNGLFETGPDLGMSPADLTLIAREYPGVFGLPPEAGGAGGSGQATALGVFEGIRAAAGHLYGSDDLSKRSVLVQGAGSVGRPLLQMLLDAGAQVKFTDIDADRATEIRQLLVVDYVDLEEVYQERCDIFSPCAIGGILNKKTIPELECRIVAGAANNQLDCPEDGLSLHERGILYVPDFVINAGGAVYLFSIERLGLSLDEAIEQVRRIGDRVRDVLEQAAEGGMSPAEAANELAARRLGSRSQAET